MDFYQEIINLILSKKIRNKDKLHEAKKKLCKKYKINRIPSDSEVLASLSSDYSYDDSILSLLIKKPTRTISGVAIVAVMTSPEPCPHGKCIPCPGGPEFETPQSYTGHEPAAMRASLNKFDPYLQTKNRLSQLSKIGHSIDKIDLIVMGGTFTSRILRYQEWFVKRCFDALNNKLSKTLNGAKKINETASSRCIGLTIETRPDWFRIQHIDNSLNLGATRVELGVQTVFDEILSNIDRGHTVSDTIFATKLAKECGLKICYHMMPGLPGSSEKIDLKSFKTIFNDQRFKPDMIKIYPTIIVPGTKLYEKWKSNEFNALSTSKASKLVAKIKESVPEWVRIQRIQRDIPLQMICSGVDKSNLRQYVEVEMKNHGTKCRCIRCREVGLRSLKEDIDLDNLDLKLKKTRYNASDGCEMFLSLEEKNKDLIIGYLRLRNITNSHRPELSRKPCAIIRELKVLGKELSIGIRKKNSIQHKGYGKELLLEAERICKDDFDKKKLYVLSGVGVKEYYRNLGFSDDGLYLFKNL